MASKVVREEDATKEQVQAQPKTPHRLTAEAVPELMKKLSRNISKKASIDDRTTEQKLRDQIATKNKRIKKLTAERDMYAKFIETYMNPTALNDAVEKFTKE